jgi:hypothetical protein
MYESNVGIAGSLDLFKLYGFTSSGSVPNIELSRLLIHFDMSSLNNAVYSGTLKPEYNSFWAKIHLYDVYGGQPTPDRFTVSITPLAQSFDEGRGKDVVYYGDFDACNFLTASSIGNTQWIVSGCANAGIPDSSPHDYFTGSWEHTQYFNTGEEDLEVDVTNVVREILTGTIENHGFRIALTPEEETDDYTYFVKRFASRHAYDDSKHPKLIIGFDDSIRDDSQGLSLDSHGTLFLYNYDNGVPSDITSGSTPVSNLKLKLQLPVSGGSYELIFSGSRYSSGLYSASVYVPSTDPIIMSAFSSSGSIVKMTPIWGSIDDSITFLTGTQVNVRTANRGSITISPKNFVVTVHGLHDVHRSDEIAQLRVNVFDYASPFITVVKVPVNSPGAFQGIVSDAFYSVRDAVTQEVVIPFDVEHGSTRLSSDAESLFFNLDMSNLTKNHTYVIDILLYVGGKQQRYNGASAIFKVSNVQ